MIAWKRAREGTGWERDGYLVIWGHWQSGEKEDGRAGCWVKELFLRASL
jgi:hypothetical protein